jgi:hypothetical protein
MCTFDEVVRANVCHNLRAWEDLSVELIFDLPTLLDDVSE